MSIMSIPRIKGAWPIIVNLRGADYSEVLYVERDGDFLCLALCPRREECKKRPLCLEEEEVEEFLVPERSDGKLKKFKSWEEAVAYAVQALQQHEQHER